MRIPEKTKSLGRRCAVIGAAGFALFLLIHYWDSIAKWLALLSGGFRPLLIGGIIAYLVNILMSCLEKKIPQAGPFRHPGLRRGLSLTAALVIIIGLIALILWLVIPQFVSCIRTLVLKAPSAINTILANEMISTYIPAGWETQLKRINWSTMIEKALHILRTGVAGGWSAVSSGFSAVVNVVLGLVFALYILLDKDNLSRQCGKLIRAYLKPAQSDSLLRFAGILNANAHKYVVGQCVEAVILGTLCALGMLLLKLPYAAMIGALVGVTALIPVAGCWIGAGVGAFMILSVSPMKALIFLIFLMILQQIENNLIYPKVVGNSVGLSGLWVLAAVTIGGAVSGILGMMASVPLAATIYQILREDVNGRLPAPPPVPETLTAGDTDQTDQQSTQGGSQ